MCPVDGCQGVVAGGVVHQADLVVDCSGRSSRIARQLELSGVLAPPVTRVTIDCAYASGFLPRSADDLDGTFLVCGTSPPTSFRGGAVLPVEGNRWMVTLAGVHGDVPGTTEDDVLAFARSLLSPAVAQLVERTGPLSSVASYRFPSSQRRRYEKVPRLLAGFVHARRRGLQLQPHLRAGHGVRRSAGRRARRYGARGGPAIGSAATAVPPQGRESHRRSMGDRRRGRLPASEDGGTEGMGDGSRQRVRPAGRQGQPHLRPTGEVVQPRAHLVEPTSSLARPSVVAGCWRPRCQDFGAKHRSAIRESARRPPASRHTSLTQHHSSRGREKGGKPPRPSPTSTAGP